ncbi:MAG: hypothetical protein ABFS46_14120 [Myxococcota bacterium]
MRSIPLLIVALFCPACQLTPTFTTGYEVPGRAAVQSLDRSLAVVPFEEARPPRLYTTTGRLFLTYVPLIPYVTSPFERLDESVKKQSEGIEAGGRGITMGATQGVAPPYEQYTYPRSFPRAISDDLNASGLFREVRFVEPDAVGDFDYVLRGSVRESPLRSTTTSFGLGMVGVLLWFIPVPMQKTTAGVTIDLRVESQETGEAVWARSLESEVSRYATMYSSALIYGRGGAFSFNLLPPPSDAKVDRNSLFSWHFEALRRAMIDARPELASALAQTR